MELAEAIQKLRLPHNIDNYDEEELYSFLSILMPGYKFKSAFEVRNSYDWSITIDDLEILIEDLVKLINTSKIKDMQTGYYGSYDVDHIEDNEYYIRIIAYKTK